MQIRMQIKLNLNVTLIPKKILKKSGNSNIHQFEPNFSSRMCIVVLILISITKFTKFHELLTELFCRSWHHRAISLMLNSHGPPFLPQSPC